MTARQTTNPAAQPHPQQAETFRCSHYVTPPELGATRLEISRMAATDPHTALCWLVARGFDVADQLDQQAAPAVIHAVQDTVMHAELLAALESGYGYGLPLPIGGETHMFEVRQPCATVERRAQEIPTGLPLPQTAAVRPAPPSGRTAATRASVAGGAT